MRAMEFVHSYFDAWNHFDPVAIADHLADDGFYCDIPENMPRSHDELVLNLQEFFSTDRHRYELIGELLEGPNTIAFRYRMCPLLQDGKSGTHRTIQGAEFVTLHHGAAMAIYDYYDLSAEQQPAGIGRVAARMNRIAKYAKSGLSGEQIAAYKQRLDRVMQSERAYLRSDLTLPKLALLVDCSINHLSQVINAGFGVSYFDYLNLLRVEHAKSLLLELDQQSNAILSIAFAVGFNSHSAFYAAFKKKVGQTPAQYRQSRTIKNG